VLEPGRRTLGNADPLAEFAVWMSYALRLVLLTQPRSAK